MTPYDLAKILWEARVREVWGSHAEVVMARDPWPPHMQHPTAVATQHELAFAEAKALLKICDVTMKGSN